MSSLGIYDSRLYFWFYDGWICSVGIKNLATTKWNTRHCFIPLTWQPNVGKSGLHHLALPDLRAAPKLVNIPGISGRGGKPSKASNSVVLPVDNEVVIMQGFLNYESRIPFADETDDRGENLGNSCPEGPSDDVVLGD